MIRLDWSENCKVFQTRQEKSDYYHDLNVALHPMVLYHAGEVTSSTTISDCLNHKAPAVFVSLLPLLDNLPSSVVELCLVSDSPTSQYRNKYIAWLLQDWFTKQERIMKIIWVYTESGHGKGPADGVGAAAKKTIDDITAYNPNRVINCTQHLIDLWPASSTIQLDQYTRDDVKLAQKALPTGLILTSKPFGLGKTHELNIEGTGLTLKKLSEHLPSVSARFSIRKPRRKTSEEDEDDEEQDEEEQDEEEQDDEETEDEEEEEEDEEEEVEKVHRHYARELSVPICVASYYLRRVCPISGLLAVVKVTDVTDLDQISVKHYKSVSDSGKLVFKQWCHGDIEVEQVERDSLLRHLPLPDMLKGGQIQFKEGDLPSSALK